VRSQQRNADHAGPRDRSVRGVLRAAGLRSVAAGMRASSASRLRAGSAARLRAGGAARLRADGAAAISGGSRACSDGAHGGAGTVCAALPERLFVPDGALQRPVPKMRVPLSVGRRLRSGCCVQRDVRLVSARRVASASSAGFNTDRHEQEQPAKIESMPRVTPVDRVMCSPATAAAPLKRGSLVLSSRGHGRFR